MRCTRIRPTILKDKAFARTVNRAEVYEGAEELAVELGEHIDFIIAALREVANEVGLEPKTEAPNQQSS